MPLTNRGKSCEKGYNKDFKTRYYKFMKWKDIEEVVASSQAPISLQFYRHWMREKLVGGDASGIE